MAEIVDVTNIVRSRNLDRGINTECCADCGCWTRSRLDKISYYGRGEALEILTFANGLALCTECMCKVQAMGSQVHWHSGYTPTETV